MEEDDRHCSTTVDLADSEMGQLLAVSFDCQITLVLARFTRHIFAVDLADRLNITTIDVFLRVIGKHQKVTTIFHDKRLSVLEEPFLVWLDFEREGRVGKKHQ